MKASLKKLIKILPPPQDPTGLEVDWPRFERILGFLYPTSFKDLVAVYGASIFLDNYSHFYPMCSTIKDVETFFETALSKFQILVDYDLYNADFQHIRAKMYPENGGLFPFMCDYYGYDYFWQMSAADSDKWPIVCLELGVLKRLEHASLAEIFLANIESMKQDDPGRIQVVRWRPPEDRSSNATSSDQSARSPDEFDSAIQNEHKMFLKKISLVKAKMDQRGGINF